MSPKNIFKKIIPERRNYPTRREFPIKPAFLKEGAPCALQKKDNIFRPVSGNSRQPLPEYPAYVAGQIKKVLDSHCVGKLFRLVLNGEEGALTLSWDYEPNLMEQQQRLLGKYVLVTSLDRETHDANQVLELYKSRHRVEDRIRAMKSTLKIRPVFLQSEERIRSPVLVNIIALIVFSLIEWVCRQEGLPKSGKQALFMFRMPAIVTLTVNGHVIQQIGNVKPFMHDILAALKVKPLELHDMDTG